MWIGTQLPLIVSLVEKQLRKNIHDGGIVVSLITSLPRYLSWKIRRCERLCSEACVSNEKLRDFVRDLPSDG